MKQILLVEDDENDVFLIRRACQQSGFPHNLKVARDGLQAVAYLSGDGPFTNRVLHPLPDLIFLDLQMPRMDGGQTLQWIRAQPQFARLPVIILTTSIASADLQKTYQLGATSFLRKGDDPAAFAKSMQFIFQYWLGYNVPAPRDATL